MHSKEFSRAFASTTVQQHQKGDPKHNILVLSSVFLISVLAFFIVHCLFFNFSRLFLNISWIFSIHASSLFIHASILFSRFGSSLLSFLRILFQLDCLFSLCLVFWVFVMSLHLLHISLSFHFNLLCLGVSFLFAGRS